ncbi:unnamed protein product [Moneuplotes crassus]|uniref:Uncharacterized protein n=1 Tax=Euplotes crassus TaxID=5936 RepID=A0AAD1UJV2_EUPCR|nr:unnamed protein product [Moneuplotes crassus]
MSQVQGRNTSSLGKDELQKSSKGMTKKDPKTMLIAKLKNVNYKLRQHLKDLNNKLEVAIDKSQTIKKQKLPVAKDNTEEEIEKVKQRIERSKKEIQRLQNILSQEHAEDESDQLTQSLKRTAELKKLHHDLEVELNDFKEENKVQKSSVNDSELKILNEKIKKKKELLAVEKELMDKRKEKIEVFEKENQKLKQQAEKGKPDTPVKPSPSEIEKVKNEIAAVEKQLKITMKKNRTDLRNREKEEYAKNSEMKEIADQLDEVNKLYRINLHKFSENERKIKYGINDRSLTSSQFNKALQSKISGNRITKSQIRSSNYGRFKKSTSRRRDLSSVNKRGQLAKAYGNNVNSSYINSSMETSSSRAYGLTNQLSKDNVNMSNFAKDNIKIKSSINDSSSKLDQTGLRELKGLKNEQKKQIETSVHL